MKTKKSGVSKLSVPFFASCPDQSFEKSQSSRDHTENVPATSGVRATADAGTRPRLLFIALPAIGMLLFCGLLVAARNAEQARAERYADAASAMRYNRILCLALTKHAVARVTTVEPVHHPSPKQSGTKDDYEICFQTDDGCRYKDRIDCETGSMYVFYRYDRPTQTPASAEPLTTHQQTTAISAKRARSLAAGYLQTIGNDAKNLQLLRVSSTAHKHIVEYVFRQRRKGKQMNNLLISVNGKDGGLDQIWFPAGG